MNLLKTNSVLEQVKNPSQSTNVKVQKSIAENLSKQ